MLADIVKIHCLTHRANFPMSRTSRIVVCKEGADEHTLTDNFPYSGSWIYCCNCQTFIAWEIGRASVSVKQCPYCHSSINPRLYVCDHCAVTMVDFDDHTLRKHHTVLNWGMPQPACPACHQFPGSTPKQHFCNVFQVNLATARPACPFCGIKNEEAAPVDGNKSMAAKYGAALAEAEARAREAEERRRLAEDTVRKEIELRVQAERKAEEIEKQVTGELSLPTALMRESEIDDIFASLIETESKSSGDAGQRVYADPIELYEADWKLSRDAEEKQNANAERREPAVSETPDNGLAIAIYAGLAVFLFLLLILIIYALIRNL